MISAFQPDIWILQTHAFGDNEQCLALAEALDCPVVIKRLDWAASAEDRVVTHRLLSDTDDGARRRRALGLQAPWPSLIVCCGRRASRVAFWVKEQSGGRTRIVSIGRAHRAIEEYDLLVGPPQFRLPKHPNVVGLRLPLARQRRQRNAPNAILPAPKPWFTILLGGEVTEFDTAESTLKEAALRAQMAADRHGGSVIVCTSRRTPQAWIAAVEGALFRPRIYRWCPASANDNHANDNSNPYDTLLRESACLFVTADSASMILDGCGSGTPTYVIESPNRLDLRRSWRRGLFNRLTHLSETLRDHGLTRAGERLNAAQDWLHAQRILRYPRDLRRIQHAVYELGLARPASAFDPEVLPIRKATQDLTRMSGLPEVVARCRALQGRIPRRAAE
jgi:mitochondrial fission protein ELM1